MSLRSPWITWKTMLFGCSLLLANPAASVPCYAVGLRIATWKIDQLYHRPGEASTIDGTLVRDWQDYEILRQHTEQIDADIIALQDVNSKAAINTVFPRSKYDAVISSGLDEDRFACWQECESNGAYTGLAIRKGIAYRRLPDLLIFPAPRGVQQAGDRRAVDLEIQTGGSTFRILSIQLPPDCSTNSGNTSFGRHCRMLADQVKARLGKWIAAREEDSIPFAIAGDFGFLSSAALEGGGLFTGIDNMSAKPATTNPIAARCASDSAGGTMSSVLLILNKGLQERTVRGLMKRRSFISEWPDRLYLSNDHCPLFTDLRFGPVG